MLKTAKPLLLVFRMVGSSTILRGQEGVPASANRTDGEKTLVVAAKAASDSIIAVPPATSVRMDLRTADDLNQTDYATDRGLFRRGDQQWPNPTQSQVGSEIIDPFFYAATLDGFHGRNVERAFGGYKLQCVYIERGPANSDPTRYCFDLNGSALRYSRRDGWFQAVYNRIVAFQGRNLAQDVDITDGGKSYLKLRVKTVELSSHINEMTFSPPPDAVGPIGDRVSGVSLTPINPPIAPH